MTKGRLEAFSDGVIAIIITIMVLEMRPPHTPTWTALQAIAPVFSSYVLSYVFVGIYWNNHHHTFQAVQKVSGGILWANLHLLFWLSLFPFVTAWMGGNHFAPVCLALYAGVALMAALSYTILIRTLIHQHGRDSLIAKAVGKDSKGNISVALYVASIPMAFVNRGISVACLIAVAMIWLVPDTRIERVVRD